MMAALTAMSSSADTSAKAAKSRAISAVNSFPDLLLGDLEQVLLPVHYLRVRGLHFDDELVSAQVTQSEVLGSPD